MKFTQMRNEVKMLLTELNMLFLKFVVLMFLFLHYFSVLCIYNIFFYNIYNIHTVYLSAFVLFSCQRLSESCSC